MENSLAAVRPDLIQEWSDRNLPLKPEDISYGTHRLIWWKGACGHEWQASAHSRTGKSHTGCPYCSGNRVLSGYNDLKTKFPEIAAEWSEKNLPITPDQVLAFSSKKVWWKGTCGHEWLARIADRTRGHGCPYCSSEKLLTGFNDLATRYPKLAAEWSEKNLPLTPDKIPVNRPGLFWWKCRECGYEYKAWISSRVKTPSCPCCSGRIVVPGINDLATTDPEIAAEWNYEKNKNIKPQSVHRLSKKIVWWTSSFGYSWQAKVSERTVGGTACNPSNSKFRRMLPQLLFMLYAKRKALRVLYNSDALTGITIDVILPDIKLAVEMESERRKLTKEQLVKLRVCEAYGYDYKLIKPCEDSNTIAEQILNILREKHIYISTNIKEDIQTVKKTYLAMLRLKGLRNI